MQRGPRVADAVGELRTPVDVAERDVVGPLEIGDRDDVERALCEALSHLAFELRGRLDARGKDVGDRDGSTAPRRTVVVDEAHRVTHDLFVRAQRLLGPEVPHESGLEVGDRVDVHGTVLVVQRDRRADGARIRRDVDPLSEKRSLEAEPRGRVVVAARHDDAGARLTDAREHVGQEAVAVCGRHRGVEHIARNDDEVDRALAHLAHETVEHAPQRVERGMAVKRSSNVPVGGVEDPHASTLLVCPDKRGRRGRARVNRGAPPPTISRAPGAASTTTRAGAPQSAAPP